MGFLSDSVGKEFTCNAGDPGSVLGSGRSPGEKKMATHCSILIWEIQGTEEPGGLQFMGSQKSWTWLRGWHITTTGIHLLDSAPKYLALPKSVRSQPSDESILCLVCNHRKLIPRNYDSCSSRGYTWWLAVWSGHHFWLYYLIYPSDAQPCLTQSTWTSVLSLMT